MDLAEESKIQFQETKLRENGSMRSIFMRADRVDMWLMAFGFIGSVFDGFSDRFPLIFLSRIMNASGSSSKVDGEVLRHNLNKNAVAMLYLACLSFVACFLEGYCWTRTGDRQATRMRAKYLKAVLRQDLAYFDLDATSTSEVITSISNDTFVIQEVIGEKVLFFVSNLSVFIGSYMVAFIVVWQLAMVALPLLFLLAIPGWLCGRSMMDLARKIRSEYNKAGTIAEMAISSIRTVYDFVGEKKTLEEFSAALNGSMKLGLRQGLIKGLAIGSNATVFAIWSLLSYYGSRLVMHDGVQGGAVFAAGISIINGGLALGACLSTMKDLAEACCANRRIVKVINRVPKIDSEDIEGIVLEDVLEIKAISNKK